MSVEIFYNNIKVNHDGPTPFITKNLEPISAGEKYGAAENITLRGTVIACSLEEFFQKQKEIIQVFLLDYKKLEIKEDSVTVFERDQVQISNISFPEDKYIGFVPFEVTLRCYPEDSFSDFFGVTEPIDQWNFQEEKGEILNISRTISAKGFVTGESKESAILNAKNFVLNRKAIQNIRPAFICSPNYNPCLIEESETIDRFTGTYSITLTYKNDLYYNENGLLRYTVDIQESIEGFDVVVISGDVEGCKDSDFQNVIDRFKSFDYYSRAYEIYNKTTGKNFLNDEFLNSSISENRKNKKIAFSFTLDSDNNPRVFVRYTTAITDDDRGFAQASIDGDIVARGNLKDRWEKMVAFFETIDIFQLANKDFKDFLGQSRNLNPNFRSKNVGKNEYDAQINFSATYDDKNLDIPDELDSIEIEVNIEPARQAVISNFLLEKKEYDVIDLGYATRRIMKISGTGIKKAEISEEASKTALKNYIDGRYLKYRFGTNEYREENSIEFNNDNSFSFNFTWTSQASSSNPNYSVIDYF